MFKKYFFICFLFFSCNNSIIEKANLIPKPQKLQIKSGYFSLNHNTNLIIDSVFFNEAKYFKKILSLDLKGKKNTVQLLKKPGLKEEEFFLNISKKKLVIEATTPQGIMRGIQTLRQLLPIKKGIIATKIPCIEIHDFPRFKWRGMLLDCCRHFMKKEFVMRYIDLLAYHKMNILRWHLTEDQGWRIEIDKYPKLTTIGSQRKDSSGSYGGYYTKEDIKEIVDYAKNKHIEVIPEIEFPGHSQAAIAAYPQLSCTGKPIDVATEWGVFKDIYCAGNDSVFTFMEDVLGEVIELFPSSFIHIGGDEAPKTRWENCPKCQKRMLKENLNDEHELQSYFIKRIEKYLNSRGKTLIGWDEILEGGLAKNAVVQSWRGMNGGIEAAKHGNKVIMSPTSHAYFDYSIKSTDMKQVYHFDPIPTELDSIQKQLVLGGECNLWSEHIPDEKN